MKEKNYSDTHFNKLLFAYVCQALFKAQRNHGGRQSRGGETLIIIYNNSKRYVIIYNYVKYTIYLII